MAADGDKIVAQSVGYFLIFNNVVDPQNVCATKTHSKTLRISLRETRSKSLLTLLLTHIQTFNVKMTVTGANLREPEWGVLR